MPKLTIQDILDKVSEGDDDIIDFMGGLLNILRIAEKKGALSNIEFWRDPWYDFQNEVIYTLISSNNPEVRNKAYEDVKTHIINNDLDKIDDQWYVVLDDLSDLSDLFNKSDRDSVSSILSEDNDIYERFWDTTDNVYRDVIQELNPNNLEVFKTIFSEKLVGQTIKVDTNLLEDICESIDSCDGFSLVVTADMIDSILNDEETTLFVLKKYLDDLRNELYNLHSNSFNSAYESELYDKVWKELSEYFIKGDYVWKKYGVKDKVLVKVTNEINNVIDDWVDKYKGTSYSDSLMSYYGSYMSVLADSMKNYREYLSISFPDYPDFRKVDNLINDNFRDYI